jgi:hypothetical protein
METDYVMGRLRSTLEALSHAGKQREKLIVAFEIFRRLSPAHDFPTMSEKFDSLSRSLTCCPAKAEEGTLKATVSRMTDRQVRGAIDDLIDLCLNVARDSS